jgi:DNA replication and repair protein RecF
MTLRRLSATSFRNLQAVDIELSPQLNIIYGDNGSGKTSLLESISILSLGRSFRSRKYKHMIQHEAEDYTVFGQVECGGTATPVGINRHRNGQAVIKVGGKHCSSAAQLAETLPIRIMNGHSFQLLEGGPAERRKFIDWLVFHVEHEFYQAWRSYEKCLKQRNSLLRRDKIDPLLMAPWDREIALLANRLDHFRHSSFRLLETVFNQLISEFAGLKGLRLSYYRGWDKDTDYSDLLSQHQDRDRELGYTRQGPHRADIRVLVEKQPAVELLSRGQQKIVVSALLIAQGMVFYETRKRGCLYLIDDLPAELDARFRSQLAEWLSRMETQIFVTGVERNTLLDAWRTAGKLPDSYRVFHVKHGAIQQEGAEINLVPL